MDDFENKDRGFDGAEQEGGTTRIDMPRRHRREEAPEDAPEREKRDVAGRIESVINKIKELLGRKSEKQVTRSCLPSAEAAAALFWSCCLPCSRSWR